MSEPPADPDSHARAIRSFWIHAVVFAGVNMALAILNRRKTPGYFWEKWVLLDWGVGLATHAWIVFRTNRSRQLS